MLGSISPDGNTIVAFSYEGEDAYYVLRLFDINDNQWSSRKVYRNQLLSVKYIYRNDPVRPTPISMTFHPIRSNLVYIAVRDDMEDDIGDSWGIVLYDTHGEGKVIAKRGRIYMGADLGFRFDDVRTLDGPVFLRQGSVIVCYHVSSVYPWEMCSCDNIVLLDAFNFDILASVQIPYGNNFAVSTCQRKIAICTREINADVEVEVYTIPDQDTSLKNLCRRKILQHAGYDRIGMLTILPAIMREYLLH